MYLKD